MKLSGLPLVLVLACAPGLRSQIVVPPGFSVASIVDASTLGIPTPLGGIEFNANGSVLYVAGQANSPSAAVYAVPVIRDPVTHFITGFGAATLHASAPYADGGLAFGPGGTLFFTTYPTNELGQIVGTTTTAQPLPGATASTGALAFVPAGMPGAGALRVSSYVAGDIFTVATTPGGNGTLIPTTATLFADLPFGTEGIRYIPTGANAGDLMVTNFFLGNISVIDINPATGLPVGGSAAPSIAAFASGIIGTEGFTFDPLTNDFVLSTYNGSPSNSIVRITGFPVPQFPLSISTPTVPLAGGIRQIFVQAGASGANRDYLILAGTSGASPGLTVAFLHLPLNIDLFTSLTYPLVNTPLFSNFLGTTNGSGSATATLNIPPLPPSASGATVTFAALLINPVNATSLSTQLQIVP